MGQNIYNVYDENGNLIIEKKTSAEISAALNGDSENIARLAQSNTLLHGKYEIVKVGKASKNDATGMILNEWDKVVAPLRKVIWVREMGPGVKRLGSK